MSALIDEAKAKRRRVNKAYRDRNKEKIAAQREVWLAANPDKTAGQRDRYQDAHRSDRAAKARERHKANPEKASAQRRTQRERYPEKEAARLAVRNAVRAGRLTRGQCEHGEGCDGRVEAHHDDYSKPLDVRWLCSRHHGEEHRACRDR